MRHSIRDSVPIGDGSERDDEVKAKVTTMRKIHIRVNKAAFFCALTCAIMCGGSAVAAIDEGDSRATAAVTAPSVDRTLLWKVERSGLRPSYVFGTIRSEDPRVADLSASVIQAFRVSSAFAMEMIPDQAALSHLSSAMFITSGPTLPALLGEDWFLCTSSLIDFYVFSKSILSSLKRWVVFIALTTPHTNQGMFLDVILY